MQTQIFRRAVLGLMALGLTLSMLAILSCGGSDDDDEMISFNGRRSCRVPTNAPCSRVEPQQALARQY